MQDRTLAETLSRSPGRLLRRVYARFTAEALSDDPRSRDFVVLDTLADQDADSQLELAERLGINRTIMVRLVDRLQQAGYVTRTRNPANRRSYVLSITEEGRKARDAMREAVAERDARVTASLTPGERERLNELLSLLLPEPEPLRTTAYLVAQAHYRLRRMGDALLAGSGLRTRHFGSLAALETLTPCAQQQLARRLDITEPAAAQIVDELVRLGLVARGQDPADRRRYALELTPLGRQRLTTVREAAEHLQAEILSLLGPEAEHELRVLLTKLLPDP
ncbi:MULTISPECIES: MarR family winged helix-turn-helix transcriptional regulator [Nonomuraea]|jgi:DNA-binding MarR family transcriptional regulator|uniref:MarR family transcriptional regulator n=1 Tax=Nonomuraea ferruginea TaxID=46174 RepID=A0ABT4SUT0_9ACTN|nr:MULTISPECIES: MarR family transcriptional regulator [Nonomuraea]MDA0641011.1 MarR family transcriptional regulator [Nonomuraea ferruginea]TXK42898.1 MarR family transcriptional regulator [Nonomuraea sp. C10]